MAELIVRVLEEEDHGARAVGRGEDAIAETLHGEWDAIVLDVGLPGMDGFVTCRALRDRGVRVPVLMLTAYDDIDDRVSGLDAGADDYLVKPFAFDELLARLRALTRRPEALRPAVLQAGGITLDPASREVRRGVGCVDLTPREFALLEVLMERAGEAVTRFELLERVWDD